MEVPWWSFAPLTCPQVPLVIKALQRQLKDRSVRARQGCFSLLTELAGVLPGSLAEHMPVLVAGRIDRNLVYAVLGLSTTWIPVPNPQGCPCSATCGGSPFLAVKTKLGHRPYLLVLDGFPGLCPLALAPAKP